MWTAIYPSLTSVTRSNLVVDSGKQSNAGDLRCHEYNSEFHICPDFPCKCNVGDNGGTPVTNFHSNFNYTSNSNSTSKSNFNSNSNSNSTVNLAPEPSGSTFIQLTRMRS